MKSTYADKTEVIIHFRDLLQAALDERLTLKQVLREIDWVIAERRKKESAP